MILSLVMALASLLQSPLSEQFAAIGGGSGGRTGAAATIVESTQSADRAGVNESERFPMQSVYKLPISMAILDQVEHGTLTLNQKTSLTAKDMAPAGLHSPIRDRYPQGGIDISIRDLIRAAIVDSDGTASDVLFRLGGGGARDGVPAGPWHPRHGGRHDGGRDVARSQGSIQELFDARCGSRAAEGALFRADAVGGIATVAARRHDGVHARTEPAQRPAAPRHGGRTQDGNGWNEGWDDARDE